jgi:hypothetical protein
MITFYCLRFQTPPTSRARSPGTGFPFCRHLRLAGLRWRYSTPSSQGQFNWLTSKRVSVITSWLRQAENTVLLLLKSFPLERVLFLKALYNWYIRISRGRCLTTALHATLLPCVPPFLFFRGLILTSVIGLTFLPPRLGSHGDYYPTVPAAPFLRLLVPSSSLIRCQSTRVYFHHPSFHIMTHNKIQTTKILLSVGDGKTT